VAEAGQAAYAYDAATAFHNPAGMARLEKPAWLVGAQAIWTDIEFDLGSQTTFSGGDGGEQGGVLPAAGLFYTRPLNDRWSVGASVAGIAGGALARTRAQDPLVADPVAATSVPIRMKLQGLRRRSIPCPSSQQPWRPRSARVRVPAQSPAG
jgi:hypothetical protein